MKKIKYLLLVPALLSVACGGNNQTSKKDKSYATINSFETIDDLYLLKFANRSHSNRGTMDLVNEHVTDGDKSLKYVAQYGTSIEMQHFFSNTVDGQVDVSDLKSISLDIYNDSDYDTTCNLTIYNTEEMNILLSKTYDLVKKQATHIEFALSSIAIEYNYETILSNSLTLFTPGINYTLGTTYTFYIDNWKANYGKEYSAEDKEYVPKIDEIVADINEADESEESDKYAQLHAISLKISALPDLYRRIIPNIETFNTLVDEYYEDISKKTINYDKDVYFYGNEFYGLSQISAQRGTKVDAYFSDELKFNETDKGSIKLCFNGSAHNNIVVESFINLENFDSITITMKNNTGRLTRVWFSYNNNKFVDFEDQETKTLTYTTATLDQEYWVFDQLIDENGTVAGGVGSFYIGAITVEGKSNETKTRLMNEAFSSLPNVNDVKTEEDILKMLSSMKTARLYYDSLDSSYTKDITSNQVANLEALEQKAQGYDVIYNSGDLAYSYFYYGEDFTSYIRENNTYGHVTSCPITANSTQQSGSNREQSFVYTTSAENTYLDHKKFVVFVYNPTKYDLHYDLRSTNWDYWNVCVTGTLSANSWNCIEFTDLIFNNSEDGKILLIISGTPDTNINGDWLFSPTYAMPN